MEPLDILKGIEDRDHPGTANDIEVAAYRRGYLRAYLQHQAEIDRLTKALEDIAIAPDFGHAYCIACDALKRWT